MKPFKPYKPLPRHPPVVSSENHECVLRYLAHCNFQRITFEDNHKDRVYTYFNRLIAEPYRLRISLEDMTSLSVDEITKILDKRLL